MNILTYIFIQLIKFYRFFISPIFGSSCRYIPTCSEYSIDALKEFGFFKGTYLSIKRILSCNPWSRGGVDPLKKKIKVRR